MSLSGALYNAFSGLKANSKAAALVSTNISNATTESYGRRSLALTAGAVGSHGGVRVDGVVRHTDTVLMADRRLSDAQLGYGETLYNFTSRIEDLVGETGTPGSLSGRVAAFENALITAAANPASTQRLESVATNAKALATTLNTLSDNLQDSRLSADRAIEQQVQSLNEGLVRLDQLNDAVVTGNSRGTDISTLLDERQRVIDSISDIVPLRAVARDRGEIALFSTGGAILLDGRPSEIGFERTNAITAGLTLADGDLSGLTLNGTPINSGATGMFAGGSLAAQFEIRDVLAVEAQADLDGMARDLVERLGPGGPDTTLGAADAGLFTDAGGAFDPLDETGLARRIELNSLVEPGGGGTWRLRDGLGAATQGEVGDARLLQGISAALTTSQPPSSTSLAPVARSFGDHMSEFASAAAGNRVRAENEQSFLASQNTALKELELSKGVDTDQELQRLMQIEQHYAANAQVMSVVDDLMQRLLNI